MSEGDVLKGIDRMDYDALYVARDFIRIIEENQRAIFGRSSERLARITEILDSDIGELSETI